MRDVAMSLTELQKAYSDRKAAQGGVYTWLEESEWSRKLLRAEYGESAVTRYDAAWQRVKNELVVERLLGEAQTLREREYAVWRETHAWAQEYGVSTR